MKTTTTFLMLLLACAVSGQTIFGPQQVITTAGVESFGLFATDLDGDGDVDVLSASRFEITWHENLGSGSFGPPHVVTTSVLGGRDVYGIDLDNDGDADVLSASFFDDKIAWYENLGGGNFGPQQVITTAANGARSVYATDLDGDGDADVLSASLYDDKIAWYENLGSGNFGFQQVVTTAADQPCSVYATDLDGDGDADVLSASQDDNNIAWYENLGGGSFGAQQVITTAVNYFFSVYAIDLDSDGDADVLSASRDDKIAWYENLGGGSFGPQQVITTAVDEAYSVYATDLDGDGDSDVLSASLYDDKIAWYENLGSGNFGSQQVVTTAADGACRVYATDLDDDGDADVLSASFIDNKIAWYENLLPSPPSPLCTTPATSLSQLEPSVDQYNDVILTDEQGYVVSGRSTGGTGMVTQRLDCTGAVLWTNEATASGSDNSGSSALDRGDGTYWVAGALSPSGSSLPDGTILRLNAATGTEQSRFQLGGTAADRFNSISATTDSGAIVAGIWASFGQEDAWLVKLDALGDTVWTRIVDAGQDDKYNDAVESDGFLYAAGERKFTIVGGSISQGLIAKYDLAGNELWRMNGLDSVSWFDMTAQVGGGFTAVGRKRYSTTDQRLIAAAYDATGNLLWVQEYGIPGQASWGGSIEAIAGGYIVAGRYNASPTASEGWLLTLDLAGNLLEEKQIEDFTGQQNTFTEVVPMPDGVRYAAVGFGGDPLAPQGWFWLGGFSCEVAGYDALPDTLSVCNQDSVLLDAGPGYSTYAWSTGATTQITYVSSSGSYSVAVTDSSGCAGTDNVMVSLLTVVVDLGDDQQICAGDSVLLDAGAGFVSYAWNTGASTPSIYVSSSDVYSVLVSDTVGCTAIDSVHVNVITLTVDLGDNQQICAGDSTQLDAGSGYSDYVWSTGDTAAVINVSSANTYSVTVTDSNGCSTSDSVGLIINVVAVDLGDDQAICAGESITLDAGDGFTMSLPPLFSESGFKSKAASSTTYTWNTGATSQTISVNATGVYSVTVEDSIGCAASDSITITVNSTLVDLGGDQQICEGDSILLDAGSTYSTYTWNTGDSTQSIYASLAGSYTVTVDSSGCSSSDAVTIVVNSVAVDLGGDLLVCQGDSVLLDAGNGYPFELMPLFSDADIKSKPATPVTYTWSTGDSTQTIYASSAGSYAVTIEDPFGCTATDSVEVSLVTATVNLGEDQEVCTGDSVLLDAGTGYFSYQWSTGATTQTIYVSSSGAYTVTVVDSIGCTASDTISVSEEVSTVTLTSCPPDIISSGTSPVSWTEPTADDNCYGSVSVTQSSGPPNGSVFPEGTTTVTYVATDSIGQTDTCSFTVTVDGPCAIPAGLISTPASNGAILSWLDDDPDRLGVQIKGRRIGDVFFATKQTAASSFAIGGLTSSTSYEWRVRAKCLDGDISGFSPLDTFTTLSLRQGDELPAIELSPNPVTTNFTVLISGQFESLVIADLLGRVCYQGQVADSYIEIDATDWASGVYLVTLEGVKGRLTEKIVVR